MSLRCLKNERGLTLIELTVALAVSSILLVAMVSGSLFVQRYIGTWQKKDVLAEELAAINREITAPMESARFVRLYADSLKLLSRERRLTSFAWHSGALVRNGKNMTRAGLHIDSLSVSRLPLHQSGDGYRFEGRDYSQAIGLFEVFIRVSSDRGLSDSIKVVVRNEYEYQKFKKR